MPTPILSNNFKKWFDLALAAQVPEPNAMTSPPHKTASRENSAVEGFDERGFVFYTNYKVTKGKS